MSSPAATPTTRRGVTRRKLVAAVGALVLAAGLVAANTLPQSESAGALPIVPPTNPTLPPTIPPTLGTAPPDPPWKVNVLMLNQDTKPGAPALGAVAADRFWLSSPIITQGAQATAAAAIVPPVSIYDPVPAGTSNLSGNQFSFPAMSLPSGSSMIMRVREAGAPGSLCRTRPVAPLPASLRPLHILVAPPIAKNATDLNNMVASFKGVVAGVPAGVFAYITSTSLTPQSTGLQLRIVGVLAITFGPTTYVFSFDYSLPLTLAPVNSTDTNQVLTVQAPNSGTLNLAWFGPPPANGNALLAAFKPAIQTQLQTSVLAQARPLVNDAVTASHDVKWWTEQGFTVSVRRVNYSNTALTVSAALCRLS